jgi:hypothetical protein
MRAVALARTLGVGSWSGLAGASSNLGHALGEAAGASSGRLQHSKVVTLRSTRPINPMHCKNAAIVPFSRHTQPPSDLGSPQAQAGGPSEPEAGDKSIPDPFDLEYDRFNGGAMADALGSVPRVRETVDLHGRPVDLEFEMDRYVLRLICSGLRL